MFGHAGLDCFALAPRDAAPLRRTLLTRDTGAVWPEGGREFRAQVVPAEAYDLLVSVRRAHPSRVLPGA